MAEASNPLVSIAMPVFNGASTLRAAVRSIELQTYRNWELLLIDDGSSDSTSSFLRELDDRRIRILVDGQRKGHGPRLNQALDLARGKYVARMDQDDICFPERLAKQVDYLETHPEIDLLATRALVFRDDGTIKGLFPFRATHAEICSRPVGGFYLPHPTWMGRAEWFRKFRYGGNEALRAEDQDLLLRSFRTSTFACLNEVMLGYRQNDLPMKSVLAGRRSFRRAVVRDALSNQRYGAIPIVVFEQFLKGMYERAVTALGLQQRLLKHRAIPVVDLQLAARWREIWSLCQVSRSLR